MDVKNQEKRQIKTLLSKYIGMYVEGIPRDREEIKKALPKILKAALKAIGLCVLGFIFGQKAIAYSAIPLGTALLCSLKKNVTFAYIGTLISAVTEKTGLALPLTLIYTALYIMRILIWRTAENEKNRHALFEEPVSVRMVEGFCASLLISMYRAASFGFLYFDILGGIFEVVSVPIFIRLFSFAGEEKYKYTVKGEVGLMSLMIMTVFALKNAHFFTFSLGAVVTVLITLSVSRSSGFTRGGTYGLICGLAFNPVTSPIYAICGMTAGLLWKAGISAALALTSIVGIVCGIYVSGWESLSNFAPSLLLASFIFVPFAKYNLITWLPAYSMGNIMSDEAEQSALLNEKRQLDTTMRFEALSSAFTELSEVFYTLSDRVRRPGIIDTRELCDRVCDAYCPKCVFHRVCWEKEYSSTSDVFSKLSKKLCETGYVEKGDVERYILQRCRNMEKIIDGINESHARLLESRIKQNKTEVFAMDYEAMAHLLESAVKINGKEYVPDAKLCENLKKASRRMNFKAHNICVYGNRKLSIVAGGVDITKVKMSANEIRTCYENICGVKLTTPKFDVDGEYITMTLEAAKRFKTEYAAAFDTKKNEKICGDMICMFENDADYFYSLISDGMGSGKEAALTSRLCGIFLKKMLVAGNSKPVALEMLNNFIRSKNTECFATVDLLEIDLIKGKAGFIKGGAAASYVLRDDKIFRISSNTMPVGITREINAEEVKFELKDNDVIVMVSDGVGQSAEDMARISDVLTYSWEDDLQKMADKILKNATSSCKRSDDVSVGLIRVKEI